MCFELLMAVMDCPEQPIELLANSCFNSLGLHSVDVYGTHFMPSTLLAAEFTNRKGIPDVMKFRVFWGRDKESK